MDNPTTIEKHRHCINLGWEVEDTMRAYLDAYKKTAGANKDVIRSREQMMEKMRNALDGYNLAIAEIEKLKKIIQGGDY